MIIFIPFVHVNYGINLMATVERLGNTKQVKNGRRDKPAMPAFVTGARTEFIGTLERHGIRLKRNSPAERWLLLVDVVRKDNGQSIAKRVWLRDGRWSRNMKTGHRYCFHARMERCRNSRLAPGISGRVNQGWRIANPNKVSEVEIAQQAKNLDGKEILTFNVRFKQREKTKPKNGLDSQEQQTAKLYDTKRADAQREVKSRAEREIRTIEVRANRRKATERKSRNNATPLPSSRGTRRGRVRLRG